MEVNDQTRAMGISVTYGVETLLDEVQGRSGGSASLC
jgi:hypothetical protein